MAIPVAALAFAAGRYLGSRALGSALARQAASRALAALANSRAAIAASKFKNLPLPVIPPNFLPDIDWGQFSIGKILPDQAYADPAQAAGYDLAGWTVTTSCGDAAYVNKLSVSSVCNYTAVATKTNWDANLDKIHRTGPVSGKYRYYFRAARWMEFPYMDATHVGHRQGVMAWKDYLVAGAPDPDTLAGDLLLPEIPPAYIPSWWAGATPAVNPAPILPNLLPQFFPEVLPIGNYAPMPVMVPYRDIPASHELPKYWPNAPYIEHPPSPVWSPGLKPYQVPIISRVEWPPVPASSSPHNRLPPGRGTKERKVRVRGIPSSMYAVREVLSGFTEAFDFLEALYRAIPDKKKPRYKNTKFAWKAPPYQVMADHVYKHLSDIDVPQAIQNVLTNELQDQIIGRLSRGARKSYTDVTGSPVGPFHRVPGM